MLFHTCTIDSAVGSRIGLQYGLGFRVSGFRDQKAHRPKDVELFRMRVVVGVCFIRLQRAQDGLINMWAVSEVSIGFSFQASGLLEGHVVGCGAVVM